MKRLMALILILIFLMAASSAMAIEEIKDVAVVDYKMKWKQKDIHNFLGYFPVVLFRGFFC